MTTHSNFPFYKRYENGKFECVVIYGRRRVGKTALINEFCKDKPTVFFSALNTTGKENLESECDTALQQIDDRMYAKEYEDDYDQILCYGISFFKKRCMVKKK